MKSPFTHRVAYITAFLSLVLLLGSQPLACLIPSLSEMGKGQAMECCTEHCRMDTTPQAAQEACQQSSQVFSQQETLSSPLGITSLAFLKLPSDLGFLHISPSPLLQFTPLLSSIAESGVTSRLIVNGAK